MARIKKFAEETKQQNKPATRQAATEEKNKVRLVLFGALLGTFATVLILTIHALSTEVHDLRSRVHNMEYKQTTVRDTKMKNL